MTHSIKCPMCSTKVTEQDEIEFVETNGRCFICDHHSIYDDVDTINDES